MAIELEEVLFNFKEKLTFLTSIPLIVPIFESRDSILRNGYI
jgi:hypothetical protein